MKHYAAWLIVLGMPLAGHAAEPIVEPGAAATQESRRFIPLDSARAAQTGPQSTAIAPKKKFYDLPSDRKSLQNGQMRIDRARAVPMPLQHTLAAEPVEKPREQPAWKPAEKPQPVEKPIPSAAAASFDDAEPESEEITGNTESYNPVLALFDTDGDAALPSFSDAMRGGGAGMGRVERHYVWPIPLSARQYVASGYGMRADPFHGRPTFHGGIDITADVGTPVLATADGQVITVDADANYGKYITLQHADGTFSRYGHLSEQRVEEGARVQAGQTIGAVGATGRATGSHLDYRVSKNGMKFDPLSVLSVPTSVAMKAGSPAAAAVAMRSRSAARVASNALPKRRMVIEVKQEDE